MQSACSVTGQQWPSDGAPAWLMVQSVWSSGRFIGPCIQSQPHVLTKSGCSSFTWDVVGVNQAALHPTRHCQLRQCFTASLWLGASRDSPADTSSGAATANVTPSCGINSARAGFVGAETPAVACSSANPRRQAPPFSEGAAGALPDFATSSSCSSNNRSAVHASRDGH